MKPVTRPYELRGDPDLSRSEKKRGMSKRAYFSLTFIVAHLDHDEAIARKMCKEVLDKWWAVRDVSGILGYDLDQKKTWNKAKNAWKKFLRRN